MRMEEKTILLLYIEAVHLLQRTVDLDKLRSELPASSVACSATILIAKSVAALVRY